MNLGRPCPLYTGGGGHHHRNGWVHKDLTRSPYIRDTQTALGGYLRSFQRRLRGGQGNNSVWGGVGTVARHLYFLKDDHAKSNRNEVENSFKDSGL